MEPLEPRILLSADLPFAFAMTGDHDDVTLSFDDASGMVQIHDSLTGEMLAEQLRAETSAIRVTGTDGDDRLKVDLAGTYIFPDGVMFDGAGGVDELVGPDVDSAWTVDGIDEGTLNGMAFEAFEKLTGGVDNEDVFTLLGLAQSTGGLEGGDGGFDTVNVEAGGLDIVSTPTGPFSGALSVGGLATTYAGFEPVGALTDASITIDLDATVHDLTLTYDAGMSGGGTDVFILDDDTGAPNTIEQHIIEVTAATTGVTINLGGGDDEITISGIDGTELAGKLTVNGQAGDDTFELDADFGTITLDVSDDSDTVDVLASSGANLTTVAGGVLTATDIAPGDVGVATLTGLDADTTITGDSIAFNFNDFKAAVDSAFGSLGDILEGLEELSEFATTLPLIGGSNVLGTVDVTIGKALGLFETIDTMRTAIIDKAETAVADGIGTVSGIAMELENVAQTVAGIAAAVQSELAAAADAIQDVTDVSNIANIVNVFSIQIEADIDGAGTGVKTVEVMASEIDSIRLAEGIDAGAALAAAINGKINSEAALSDFVGKVSAVYTGGRFAIQVIDSTVEEFKVRASGAANNLADTLFGFASTFEDKATLLAEDIVGRLTALGDLGLDLQNVALAQIGEGFSFGFDLLATRVTDFAFDFGASAESLGLSFDSAGKLSLGVGFKLSAELEMSASSFSGMISEFGVGAEINSTTPLTVTASFGPLEGTAEGTVVAAAAVVGNLGGGVSIDDGFDAATFDTTLNFGTASFDYDFGTDAITFGAVGSAVNFDVNLTFEVGQNLIEIGGLTAGGTITASGALFGGGDPTITFTGSGPDFEQAILDFTNMSVTEYIAIITDFIEWLDQTTGSALLSGIDLPFIEGGLDDFANIAERLSNELLFDVGGDGEKDDTGGASTRLITDIDNALITAGLDNFIRAVGVPDGNGIKFEAASDGVTSAVVSAPNGLLLPEGFSALGIGVGTDLLAGDGVFALTGALLTGKLATSLAATITVTKNGSPIARQFVMDKDVTDDNVAVGDDIARLIDRFNAPTFDSVQGFIERLGTTGLLSSLPVVSDLSEYYDPLTDQLFFSLDLTDKPLFDVELAADFDLDLGSIASVSSDTRLVLSGTGSLQLGIGIDLSSDGALPGTGTDVSGTTTLADLEIEAKSDNAVTGTEVPTAATDLAFTVKLTEGAGSEQTFDVMVNNLDLSDSDDLSVFGPQILAAVNGALAAPVTLSLNGDDIVEFAYTGAEANYVITVEADQTTAAAALLGLAETATSTDATLVGARALVPFTALGVLGDDLTLSVELSTGGAPDIYEVTIPASSSLLVSDGTISRVNGNILDVVGMVKTAMESVEFPASSGTFVDLNDFVDVGFQGSFLVLTVKPDMAPNYTDIKLTSAVPELGLPDTAGNTDDILLRFDDGSTLTVDVTSAVTIDDVLTAIQTALNSGPGGAGGTAEITPDDPGTPIDESGRSLRVSYDVGGIKLLAIEATNGSGAASGLGIVGMDFNMALPLEDDNTPDGTIEGLDIGGVRLADRFFIKAPDGGSLDEIASFQFEATAGRLVEDLQVFGAGGDILFSSSVDLRDFVTTEGDKLTIEIRGVNGFNDGTYTLDSIVAIDTDGDMTDDAEGVMVTGGSPGVEGQNGGVGVIDTGVQAAASLGFVGVELSGIADFGAKAAIGLNTNFPSLSDGILSLGEVLEFFEADAALDLLDLFAFPSIEFLPGETQFGTVDLELALAGGSAGFEAIADALLDGNTSVAIGVDILALGDPFLKTRFDQAGGFTIGGGGTSFDVSGDFTQILAEKADLRFTVDDGGTTKVFDANMVSVSESGGTTTVTLDGFKQVTGFGTGEADPTLNTGTIENVILLPSADVTLPDFGALSLPDFGEFGLEQILDALLLLVDFLSEFESFDFLQQKIPVLDKSISELFALADDLRDFVNELRANPAGSLQFLEDAINDAIGISPTTVQNVYETVNGTMVGAPTDVFEIGYVTTNNQEMLTFELNLGFGFSQALDIGFEDIGFGDLFGDLGIDGLVNFSGSAGLAAEGGILLTLGLGIDLGEFASAPTQPLDAVYLLEDTGLEAALNVAGQNLAFSAGLGPFALAIQDSDADMAEISIDTGVELATKSSGFTDGRAALSSFNLTNLFEVNGTAAGGSFGSVMGVLPIFFPNDANLIGAIRIGEEAGAGLGNLQNLITNGFAFTTTADQLATEAAAADKKVVVDVSELVSFFTDFDFSSFSLFDTIRLAVDGFDGFLTLLEENIFGAIAALNVPLVGSAFGDAANFIGDFRTGFVGDFRTAIDAIEDAATDFTDPDKNIISKLLFDLLGPEGLDLLQPLAGNPNGSAANLPGFYIGLDSDLLAAVLFDGADFNTAEIAWSFDIGQNIPVLDGVALDFDIGIPGLGLETNADIDFSLEWALGLGFGLSAREGFFLDVSRDRELEFAVEVVPEGEITGELAFLGLTAETADGRDIDGDGDDEVTGLFAEFGVAITDSVMQSGDDTDRLSLTEFGDIGIELFAEIEAAALLDLRLGLSDDLVGSAVASGFPSITADFELLWCLDSSFVLLGGTPGDPSSSLETGLKYLAFNNVELDLGEFVTEVLGPIVDAVSEFTEPLQPFIDFLTAPIPLIDVFGVNLTMLDLAATFGNIDTGLIETLAEIITLINDIAALRAAGGDLNLAIPIASFVIFNDTGIGDAQSDNPFSSGFSRGGLMDSRMSDFAGLADDVSQAIESATTNGSSSNQMAASTINKNLKPGGSFAFPFIEDPSQIFGILLGDPATLVTFDLEPLFVEFEKSFFFSIFGPLGVSLGLTIEFMADFAFGYDTLGIQNFVETDFSNPLLLFDGFFISDGANPDGSGDDVPELRFLGGITAAAELNLGVARAGVAGGLFIEILFDLFDPDGDGKVRINELVSNVVNQTRAPSDAAKLLAPLAIFDVTGEIFARLFAFLKIDLFFFEIDKEWDLVDPITILDFEIDFFRPPVVASETDDGGLIANVGEFASQRLLGDATDFGETIHIRKKSQSGDDITVEVWTDTNGFGSDSPTSGNRFEYKMKAGEELVVKSGAGDDKIFFEDWDGDEVYFNVETGAGNDMIMFSGGSTPGGTPTRFNNLDGGVGRDTIVGSNAADLIRGGAGDDNLDGGAGQDLIVGDQVDFFEESLVAKVLGNDGVDTLHGGDAHDIILGGGGTDSITGGDGDDLILSDGGQIAFSSPGLKILSNVKALHLDGVTGTDKLGEGDADIIDAGDGNNVIFASGGNDSITSGADNDTVFAGEGFDTISAGDGNNLVFGDLGQVLEALSGSAADLKTNAAALTNSTGFTALVAKVAVGSGGAGDMITTGDDKDFIFASSGNDHVMAGGGNDLVFGGAGADTLEGGSGNDDLRGESQADLLIGGPEEDPMDGTSDRDTLNGGTGPDDVFGGWDVDTIIATKGSDDLNGQEGGDTYLVNLSGGTTTSFIDITDGGTGSADADILQVNGTDRADRFLIRSDTSGSNAFIAGLNGEFNVERVNYGSTLERIIVNGGAGDDVFAVDDTAAEMTLNGEAGDDSFQIGQLFRTERNVNLEEGGIDTGIDSEDFFLTIEVTRGWLSNGISFPMTVDGGIGDDLFVVFHNKAVLSLNGASGDDIFEIRAFALAGSQEPQRERTDLTGGAGADLVRYAVNAPVNIDGGDGFDTLIVIGTEFGDDFVITDDGVFGAGLNVNFVNIESLRVDGAEGDDRFFLQSTRETVLTELFGGLGNDTFNASGPTPPVVSDDFRGHSGIITHGMESGDSRYDGQNVFGISANVADDEKPFAILTETQGSTIVTEGDTVGDTYQIVLTRQPTRDVFVVVGAPLPSPDNRNLGAYAFRVDSTHPDAETRDDGSTVTLKFTAANWDQAQTVQVIAAGVAEDVGLLYTRSDKAGFDPEDPRPFNFDDDAYEGQRNGVITHIFRSGETISGDETSLISVPSDDELVIFQPGLSANDLIGRTITFTEGPGFGEFRFITEAAELGLGFLSLTVQKPFSVAEEPVAGSTAYTIRIDDAIVGTPASFMEMKADEIFDDRSTLTANNADGTPVQFGTDNELVGSVIELIGGPGAGQELLILEHTDTELTLNGIWNIDPVVGETIFRIQQYDGVNSQVVEVTINDNDTPGLIVDQTLDLNGLGDVIASDNTLTAVIEGSDGDQTGEADVLRLKLNQTIPAGQSVALGLTYDATQIKVVAAGDGPGGTALTSLLFTSATPADGFLVEIYAVDDVKREAAHTALIEFDFTPSAGLTDETPVAAPTLTLDVSDSDPISSFGLEFVPSSITELRVDGVLQTEGVDYLLIEGSSTILFLDDTLSQPGSPVPEERFGVISVDYEYVVPSFASAFAPGVLVRIADDDAPTMLVRETGGSTDVIEGGATDTYQVVLTAAPTAPVTVTLSEIITKTTKTGGIRFDMAQVQITAAEQDGAPLTITRTDALDPSGNPIEYAGLDGIDGNGDDARVTQFSVTFDDTNWDKPITLTVEAIDDEVFDGDDTQVFAPGPATLSGILGPVVVNGAGGNGSLVGIAEPLMLPGEKNQKPPTGEILQIDNGAGTVTTSRADLTGLVLDDLRLRVDPGDMPVELPLASNSEIMELIGKTLEIVRAPEAPGVIDQFRLIIAVEIDDKGTGALEDDEITFTLNEGFDLEAGETFDLTGAEAPDDGGPLENRYALTSESLNFFVDETQSIDVMFVNDDDSPADTPALLTANRLSGLNMGPNVVIGERERQGGITFGELEVLDITLGSGYNALEVNGTPQATNGANGTASQTFTIIRTGTEVADPNQPGVPVGDVVTVDLNATDVVIASGTGYTAQNPAPGTGFQTQVTLGTDLTGLDLVGQQFLVMDGENGPQAERWITEIVDAVAGIIAVDAPLEDTDGTGLDWQLFNPADGTVSIDLQGGDDQLTATPGTDLGLIIFGGDGNDTITSGSGEDIVFGDRGRVDFTNYDGEIVTRLGDAPDPILGFAEAPFVAGVLNTNQTVLPVADASTGLADDPFETADTGLTGLFVDINNGTGFLQEARLITSNTNSSMTITPNFTETLDATSEFRVSTLPEDQTDGIFWGPSTILAVASAGGGDDVITTGDGDDVAMGGEGGDTIDAGADDDLIFGDLGVIKNGFSPLAPMMPVAGDRVDTIRNRVMSIDILNGERDVIIAGTGADVAFGGAGGDDVFGETQAVDPVGEPDILFGDVGLLEFDGDGVLQHAATYSVDGGDDTITGDQGADIILGGGGSDSIRGGEGSDPDIIIGDNGSALFDTSLGFSSLIEIQTADAQFGGNDTIEAGNGADVVLGGSGMDTIVAGGTDDAADIVFGDNGLALLTVAGVLVNIRSTDTEQGDDDVITTGNGPDVVVGGAGKDVILGAQGGTLADVDDVLLLVAAEDLESIDLGDDAQDVILGDAGEANFTPAGELEDIFSIASADGDDDVIVSGNGADIVIGGTGGDDIVAGGDDDNDVVIGDNGFAQFDPASPESVLRFIETTHPDDFGDDNIVTGNGRDVVLAGSGNDLVLAGGTDAAQDVVLGDNGSATFNALGVLVEIQTVDVDQPGADVITTGNGRDIVMGGVDNDIILAASAGSAADVAALQALVLAQDYDAIPEGDLADDVAVGDNGIAIFTDDGELLRIDTTDAMSGGDDIIITGNGDDVVFGGTGNDTVVASVRTNADDNAKDIVFGDNGYATFQTSAPFDPGEDEAVLSFNFGANKKRTTITGTAGVVPADNWNNFAQNGPTTFGDEAGEFIFFDDGEIAPGIVVEWGKNLDSDPEPLIDLRHGQIKPKGDQDKKLFEGFLYTGFKQTLGVNISGLSEHFSTADIYVYLDADNGRSYPGSSVRSISDGTTTFYLDDPDGNTFTGTYVEVDSTDPAAAEQGNYVVFRDVTSNDFELRIEAETFRSENKPAISAIQIDGTSLPIDRIESLDPGYGGNDILITGGGADIAVGGLGDDLIEAFGPATRAILDADVVAGDHARGTFKAGELREFYSMFPSEGGDDTILTGNGEDVVLGGAANDEIGAGVEQDYDLGDITVLSINFASTVPEGSVDGVAGIVQVDGWNNLPENDGFPGDPAETAQTENTLLLNDGSVSGASIVWGADLGADPDSALFTDGNQDLDPDTQNGRVFEGSQYIDFNSTLGVDISGLDQSFTGAYDVYVYFDIGSDLTDVGTSPRAIALDETFYLDDPSGNTFSGEFIEVTSTDPNAPAVGNYVVFRDVVGAQFSLRIDDADGSLFTNPAIAAMQIVGGPDKDGVIDIEKGVFGGDYDTDVVAGDNARALFFKDDVYELESTHIGQGGSDLIRTGDDGDKIVGGANGDTTAGGTDLDDLMGDEIIAGEGDDLILGDAAKLLMYELDVIGLDRFDSDGDGSTFKPFVQTGIILLETLIGDNDVIEGGRDSDLMYGQFGNDTFRFVGGGLGTDDIAEAGNSNAAPNDAHDGLDFSLFSSPATVDTRVSDFRIVNGDTTFGAINLELRLSSGTALEVVRGSEQSDLIFGNTRNNTLIGLAGNDTLLGQDGDDVLAGGVGDDSLAGQNGNDIQDGGAGDDIINGRGKDFILGGEGNDTINPETKSDVIDAEAGDDLVLEGLGNDTVKGGTGNDTIEGITSGDIIEGGLGVDVFEGSPAATIEQELFPGGIDLQATFLAFDASFSREGKPSDLPLPIDPTADPREWVQPLLDALGAASGHPLTAMMMGSGGAELTQAELAQVLPAAIARVAEQAGLDDAQVAALLAIDVRVADLGGKTIGLQRGDTILVDIDGAGTGYFVDQTPLADEEFDDAGRALAGSEAEGKYDLTSVLVHELGHALGFDHLSPYSEGAFALGMLDPGQRLGLIELDGANSDAAPQAGSEQGVMVFDEASGEMVSEEEAALLEMLEDDSDLLTLGGGGAQLVNWAAE